mmetsp:Transcript_64495/g.140417  ORF Transcript_64495/g.140417 Transcript_64495/m.140417 type:complete len:214 (-) Transcript_64495:520-1161(-)
MPLLPEELPRAQERRCLLHLPSHNAAPLVELDGEISVGLHPIGVRSVHGRLARGTDSHWLFDVLVAELRHPGQLRREVVEVVLLLLNVALRDEHGEVAVLNPNQLDLGVQPALNELPDPVGPLPQDEAALHRVGLDQLSLLNHLLVPQGHVVGFLDLDAAAFAGLGQRCRCFFLLLWLLALLLLGLWLCLGCCSGFGGGLRGSRRGSSRLELL